MRVAAQAIFLRSVVDADWGHQADEAIAIAMTELRDALDELELSQPTVHLQLLDDMARAVEALRGDLSD